MGGDRHQRREDCMAQASKMEATKTEATKTDEPAGEHVRGQTRDLTGFDYNASAELFFGRSRAGKSRPKYKRFDTAAEAVRFVVDELPAAVLPGTYLLVDEVRFGVDEIRSLYESAGYPLSRDVEKC
jgi:hypothetical protein